MAIDIIIPSPGESVTEVTLGAWHKRSGEWVNKDEALVEIESDKVTLEVAAPEAGLLEIKAKSGAEMRVGDKIGSIDPSAKRPAGGDGAATRSSASPAPSQADHAAHSATRVEAATESASQRADEAARATPVARKIAADKGIDLAKLQGSGPAGRIRKSDVLAASAGPSTAAPSASKPLVPAPMIVAVSSAGQRGIRREKMTKLRQRIAQRLVAAQHEAAMLTTFNECDMTEVMRLRSQHKDDFEKRYGVGLGFMSFFVRACVGALQQFPRVNAYVVGDDIEFHDFVDVSVAVSTDKGLVVPVIRNAELMSFADIEAAIKDLATRAREGKLTLEEMTGGTFTITNGGIYGSLNSTPILNPPQSGILGMHAIKKRAIEFPANSGQIALRPMMYLALSYDHRIVDGSEAVSFLVHVRNLIENPERMLLGV
ncbi:MAG: 2-oxoglutarate dehydrogenase complex dihydrolipoyllysine-residue succinyltransferase [Phycisphaerales bacterium]|nr:2-oxoglutarate dehydrogenase complex dihydrolipoyllysine-residue succinyltransferase [Phycisphaerales bacterium]MCI0676427.1 2-oxoglutarate dehydrogenase complex dihydrolipoyllysine-residue succinyltransferase [Phycisphaerales bacterium]